jgi:DNA helicase HerA-like ATPase
MLGAGVLIATVISIPDWYSILISVSPNDEVQTVVENAIDPNVLLVSADQRMLPGRLIKVVGEKGTVKGVVVANLAHKTGTRTQVALQAPWTDVVGASGAPVRIVRCADEHDPVLGLVSEGSTDRQLDLRSFGSLSRGDTVYWKNPEGVLNLYQISRLELRQSVWDGATVISEHSTAIALGTIEKDEIEPDYQLPLPLEPVFGAEKISIQLSDSFVRIGNIASTQVPVGVSVKSLRGQHTAILGMSGMGKSTIARRLMDILTNDGTVVALDGTGEYKSRFAMSEWKSQSPLPIGGKWVYQPIGVQSDAAMNFIKQVMGIAAGEYKRGTPSSRTILLEEAHSFLPEWNFAISRDETNTVSDSCRCILQARKFNINFIFVSQRTAVISKSALSQCESYIIFRTLDDTSLQYIEGVVGAGFRDIVSSLKRFQAVCVGPAFSTSIPVVVDLDPYSEPSSEAEYIPEGNIQDQK